ncbi:MAG: SCO family protein [Geobacteraceae bacterium]|nr:SCO family protein [Geobacteraceae bacterium]
MICLRQKLLRSGRQLLLFTSLLVLFSASGTATCAEPARAGQVSATGVDERLGSRIPLDIRFRDETGRLVRLADLVTGPTIILPVYYNCRNVCAYQQGRMAGTLQELERRPIDDYKVISISFDETETPEMAARSKHTYLAAIRKPFPADGWRFLTGDAASIHRLTDAIGFHFQRQGSEFIHPVATVVISADGTIIRYLYGIAILPKDLALAIVEAKSGVAGASVRKMMQYCFTYDPVGKTYIFNLLRVSATAVILCAGSFLLFLLLTGKKRTPPQSEDS